MGCRTSIWESLAPRWRRPKHTMPQHSSTASRQGQSISPRRGGWQAPVGVWWDPLGGHPGLPGEGPGDPGGVAGGGAEGCLEGRVSAPFRCADHPLACRRDSLQAGEQGTQDRVSGANASQLPARAQHNAVHVRVVVDCFQPLAELCRVFTAYKRAQALAGPPVPSAYGLAP